MASTLTPTQQRASSPDCSVWLSAHAGTGKTKVLVDRVLRLLLNGAEPGSILAITYTKAAAAEMQLRIRKKLADWSNLSQDDLSDELLALLNRAPTIEEQRRATRLLMDLLEDTHGLTIQTIHGFCQSLLARFPIEAGLHAVPQVMDDRQARQLLHNAQQRLFAGIQHANDDALQQALSHLVTSLGDNALSAAIDALIDAHETLFSVWEKPQGLEQYRDALHTLLSVERTRSVERYLDERPIKQAQVIEVIDWLQQGSKSDQSLAANMLQWHEAESTLTGLLEYAKAFVTQKVEPKKKIVTNDLAKAKPDFATLLEQEQMWAYRLLQHEQRLSVAALSESLAIIGQAMLAYYRAQKDRMGLLDYQDLIERVIQLLSKPGYCEWVMSKLDRQLQHILLDEAQDTNPLQWQLIKLLVEELFVPELYEGSPRTLFVVGDKKQSIYRFQGADPEGFVQYGEHYARWFEQTNQPFETLTLDQSFRSSEAVLCFVDTLAEQPAIKAALSEHDIAHAVHRQNQPGVVELWPLADASERKAIMPPWEAVEADHAIDNPQSELADRIVQQLTTWLSENRWLASKERAVQPGDIMVLVRRRNAFVNMLSQRLQQAGIPVTGSDRIRLQEHLAVQDIVVLAEWCLLSLDDLGLATILKGPLFQCTEEQLFELAYERTGSLWQALEDHESDWAKAIARQLHEIRDTRHLAPYEWLRYVLDQCDMQSSLRRAFGCEIDDILGELKQQALNYESQETPSLQGFVAWMQSGQFDIKREMEQEQNAVRIMTVHGAKGLQAPIVFVPDTTQIPQSRDAVLWAVKEQMPLALIAPQGSVLPSELQSVNEEMRIAEKAEYARLLYVALTRAEDELYLCGYPTRQSLPEDCWYRWLEMAMDALNCVPNEHGIRRFARHESEHVPIPKDIMHETPKPLPDWLNQPIQHRSKQPEILTPSKLFPYEHVSDGDSDGLAIDRGNLTHQLLEILSSASPDREQLMQIARRLAPDYTDIGALIDEVLAIHRHPDCMSFFGANSRAEVTVQGAVQWNGQRHPISGMIDRLVIGEEHVSIIDYKSNRVVPPEVPDAYAYQLAAYRVMLEPAFPDKPIKAALLWTVEPRLQWLDDALLETLCKEMRPGLDSNAA